MNELNKLEIDTEQKKLIPEKEKEYTLDSIISTYGYGMHIWKIIIIATLLIGVDGYFTTIFSSMLLAYQKKFDLEENTLMLISALFYKLKMIGAILPNFSSNIISRYSIINISLSILILSSASHIIWNNLYMLWITRAIEGLFTGVIEVISVVSLCENMPVTYRGMVLSSIWVGYGIFQAFPNIIMLNIMPNYEIDGIKLVLSLSLIMIFLTFIISLFFYEDSPRNLIIIGQEEKAIKILKIYDPNCINYKDQIVSQVIKGLNQELTGTLCELFNKNYIVISIILIILSIITNMLNDGFTLIVSLTLNEVNQSKNVLKDIVILNLSSLPSYLIAGYLSEIPNLGRKWTSFIGYCLLMIVAILTISIPSYISLFLSLYYSIINICYVLLVSFTPEIYPTKLRTKGSGMTTKFLCLGSIISQYVFISLHGITPFTPFYFIIGICFLAIISNLFIPTDTFNKQLDTYSI